jgi:hypothetical protein
MPVRDGYRCEQTVTIELSIPKTRARRSALVQKRKPVLKGR